MGRPKTYRRKWEIAQELGVTRGRLSQMLKAGMPVRQDGLIDRDVAAEWYSKHVRPRVKPSATPKPEPTIELAKTGVADHAGNDDATAGVLGNDEYLRSRTRHEVARATRAELDLAVREGELYEASQIDAWWVTVAVKVHDEVMALPSRIVNRLPEEWRRQVNILATEETRRALSAISHEFSQPAAGPESARGRISAA